MSRPPRPSGRGSSLVPTASNDVSIIGAVTSAQSTSTSLIDPVAVPESSQYVSSTNNSNPRVHSGVTNLPCAKSTSTLLFDSSTPNVAGTTTSAPPLISGQTPAVTVISQKSGTVSIPNLTESPSPGPSSGSNTSAQSGANPRIIAPVCSAILALLLLLGVLYFRITRKRWPFTGNRNPRITPEPYNTKRFNQLAPPKNQPLNGGSESGGSSGRSNRNVQQGYAFIAHHPRSKTEAPRPREQHLEQQYATLMREVENLKVQLVIVGGQSTQRIDRLQDDEPPDYSSQAGFAEARPPRVTREKIRNS